MLLTDQRYREVIARFVARKQGIQPREDNYIAIGLANAESGIVAGAIFHGYEHPNILMQVSADVMTPQFVAGMMRYPFLQLGCSRVTGLIHKKNAASREFALHLGAKLEGVMRKASVQGDVMIYGLMREAAEKWLTPRYQARLIELEHREAA